MQPKYLAKLTVPLKAKSLQKGEMVELYMIFILKFFFIDYYYFIIIFIYLVYLFTFVLICLANRQ